MILSSLKEAARVMNGRLDGADAPFRGVSTDTRSLCANELFVALRGPNFDGRQFIDQAAEKGAAGAVVPEPTGSALPTIVVDDTLKALGLLAGHWRRQVPARLVALTGSNGKTTLKEMIASCLARVGATWATEGNLNNEIGVPLTLLRLSPEHAYAVVEMGANHAGEIAYLVECASPEIVAITNAGAAHLEGFGSMDGIARAKGEILQGTVRPAAAVLNADDKYFGYWCSLADDVPVLSFGTSPKATVRVTNIVERDGLSFELELPDEKIHVDLPLSGRHNALNAAAGAAVAVALKVPAAAIREGLHTVRPVAGRIVPRAGRGGMRLFDDSYNANPDSVKAAAAFLAAQEGEGWLVLGDMKELGKDADPLHRDVGTAARAAGVRRLYAFGEHSKAAAAAFGDEGRHFDSVEALIDTLRRDLDSTPAQNVLVKGSRSMRMERVVAALAEADRNGEAA